jgi:putative ABC transport system substrate-binding protein
MKKKILFAVVFCMMVVIPLSVMLNAHKAIAESKQYVIGITMIITHEALESCKKGFIDLLAKEGFKEGVNVKYDFRNPEGDMTVASSIAQKFVSDKVDLIFSISTPVTQACAKAAQGTNIPIVFGAVTDPVAGGFTKTWDKPGGNVTGASDWSDVEFQVKLGLDIVTKVKKLGVVYNAGEVPAVVQIDELKKVSSKLGIEEIVEATASTTADVYAAAMSLVGKVDAIWLPNDNTLASAMDSVVKVCEENTIPLLAAGIPMAEKGAISGAGFSYYENGVDAGKIAVRILKGEKPGDIPVSRMEMTQIYVNPTAAKRMGVTVPSGILSKATTIGK